MITFPKTVDDKPFKLTHNYILLGLFQIVKRIFNIIINIVTLC